MERNFRRNTLESGIQLRIRDRFQQPYTFDPEHNNLFLHIQVPLKIPQRPKFYQLLNVRPKPFPCDGKYCKLFGNETASPEMIAFPNENSWIMDGKSLYKEAFKSDLICRPTGNREVCFTFQPNSLMMPSKCSQSVIPFNSSEIVKNCKFVLKELNQYSPISIGSHRYIIHSKIVPRYVLSCRGLPSQEITTESFATVIEIETFCDVYLPSLGLQLKGPFEGPLRTNVSHQPQFYHLSLIKDIHQKFNETQEYLGINKLYNNENISYLREFDPDEYNLQFEFDNERLTAITSYLYKTQNELAQMVFSADGSYKFARAHFTIWTYLSMFGDAVRILTTLVIIFGFLSYSRFLAFLYHQ